MEHRAESKDHVDALSRPVATAVQGGTLDKVKVTRKQARDTPARNGSQKPVAENESSLQEEATFRIGENQMNYAS